MMKDVTLKHEGTEFTVGLLEENYAAQSNKRGIQYVNVYDSRFFDYLSHRIIRRVEKRFDNRIIIAGPPRTGKTTIAITWARRIDAGFPVENITFCLEDFKNCLNSLPAADPKNGIYPTAILDEAGTDLYAKDWATTMVKHMVKIFGIVGARRHTMMMNLPHRNLLSKDIRDSMHFWLNTRLFHEYRGFCEVREAEDSPWREPYQAPLCGLVYDEVSGPFWNEYEKRKMDFIDDYTRKEPVSTSVRVKKLMEQRDKALRELRKHNTLREIETIVGLDDASVSRITEGKRNNPPVSHPPRPT